jgi:hypothetical protein
MYGENITYINNTTQSLPSEALILRIINSIVGFHFFNIIFPGEVISLIFDRISQFVNSGLNEHFYLLTDTDSQLTHRFGKR